MIKALKQLYLREQYEPSYLSIFFNAGYFSKGRIYKYLQLCAPGLKGNLLDVGCGQKPYRKLFNVEKYTGIEIASEANKAPKGAVDALYNGEEIPFGDATFDSVFSSEVFEHVFNLDTVLKEIYRVTKPGGQLLITSEVEN